MSNAEVVLTLARSLITVWLSLLVAALLWLGRRAVVRARHEVQVICRGLRLRTRRALWDGFDALAALSWILAAALVAVPLFLAFGPLLLAIAGLDLTVHVVKIGH